MIDRAHDWLPHGVVTDDAVRETIERAVAQWSARWFVGPYALVTGLKSASSDPRNENDDAGWRIYGSAIAIRGARQVLSRMIDRALDVSTEMTKLTETDQVLLDALERKILDDLAGELSLAFDLTGEQTQHKRMRDPLADGGGVVIALTEPSGREALTLAVTADAVVSKVKTLLGPANKPAQSLQPLAGALGGVHVAIEALVGKVELTLTELNDLSVGDVLVLDRALDQAVDIVGAGSRHVFAKAMLTQVDDGIALVFNA